MTPFDPPFEVSLFGWPRWNGALNLSSLLLAFMGYLSMYYQPSGCMTPGDLEPPSLFHKFVYLYCKYFIVLILDKTPLIVAFWVLHSWDDQLRIAHGIIVLLNLQVCPTLPGICPLISIIQTCVCTPQRATNPSTTTVVFVSPAVHYFVWHMHISPATSNSQRECFEHIVDMEPQSLASLRFQVGYYQIHVACMVTASFHGSAPTMNCLTSPAILNGFAWSKFQWLCLISAFHDPAGQRF